MKIEKKMYLDNLNIVLEADIKSKSMATKVMIEQEVENIIKKYAISKNIVEMISQLASVLNECEVDYLIVSIGNIAVYEYISYINYELDSYRFIDNTSNIRLNYDKNIGLNVQAAGKMNDDTLFRVKNKIINISKLNALNSRIIDEEKNVKSLTLLK